MLAGMKGVVVPPISDDKMLVTASLRGDTRGLTVADAGYAVQR